MNLLFRSIFDTSSILNNKSDNSDDNDAKCLSSSFGKHSYGSPVPSDHQRYKTKSGSVRKSWSYSLTIGSCHTVGTSMYSTMSTVLLLWIMLISFGTDCLADTSVPLSGTWPPTTGLAHRFGSQYTIGGMDSGFRKGTLTSLAADSRNNPSGDQWTSATTTTTTTSNAPGQQSSRPYETAESSNVVHKFQFAFQHNDHHHHHPYPYQTVRRNQPRDLLRDGGGGGGGVDGRYALSTSQLLSPYETVSLISDRYQTPIGSGVFVDEGTVQPIHDGTATVSVDDNDDDEVEDDEPVDSDSPNRNTVAYRGNLDAYYKIHNNHSIQNIVIPLPAHRLNDRSLATGVIVISQDHRFAPDLSDPALATMGGSANNRQYNTGRHYHYELLSSKLDINNKTVTQKPDKDAVQTEPVNQQNQTELTNPTERPKVENNQSTELDLGSEVVQNENRPINKEINEDTNDDEDNEEENEEDLTEETEREGVALENSGEEMLRKRRTDRNQKQTVKSEKDTDLDRSAPSVKITIEDNKKSKSKQKKESTSTKIRVSRPSSNTVNINLVKNDTNEPKSTPTNNVTASNILHFGDRKKEIQTEKRNKDTRKSRTKKKTALKQLKPTTPGTGGENTTTRHDVGNSEMDVTTQPSTVSIPSPTTTPTSVLNSLVKELNQAIASRMKELESLEQGMVNLTKQTTVGQVDSATMTTAIPDLSTTVSDLMVNTEDSVEDVDITTVSNSDKEETIEMTTSETPNQSESNENEDSTGDVALGTTTTTATTQPESDLSVSVESSEENDSSIEPLLPLSSSEEEEDQMNESSKETEVKGGSISVSQTTTEKVPVTATTLTSTVVTSTVRSTSRATNPSPTTTTTTTIAPNTSTTSAKLLSSKRKSKKSKSKSKPKSPQSVEETSKKSKRKSSTSLITESSKSRSSDRPKSQSSSGKSQSNGLIKVKMNLTIPTVSSGSSGTFDSQRSKSTVNRSSKEPSGKKISLSAKSSEVGVESSVGSDKSIRLSLGITPKVSLRASSPIQAEGSVSGPNHSSTGEIIWNLWKPNHLKSNQAEWRNRESKDSSESSAQETRDPEPENVVRKPPGPPKIPNNFGFANSLRGSALYDYDDGNNRNGAPIDDPSVFQGRKFLERTRDFGHDYNDESDDGGDEDGDSDDDDGSEDDDDDLGESNVPGTPGIDYPIYGYIPETNFDCNQQQYPGFYSDMEVGCQVYHSCSANHVAKDGTRQSGNVATLSTSGANSQRLSTKNLVGGKHSFLCPNGTIFSQEYLICDWWYNVKCSESPRFYPLNRDVFASGQNDKPISLVPLNSGTQFGGREDTAKHQIIALEQSPSMLSLERTMPMADPQRNRYRFQ